MKITIEHIGGDRPQFNVSLASVDGKQPFLTIKGCRIVHGGSGAFVSWPATKNEKSGKWWSHCWASDGFNAAVLAEAQKEQQPTPNAAVRARQTPDDPPF